MSRTVWLLLIVSCALCWKQTSASARLRYRPPRADCSCKASKGVLLYKSICDGPVDYLLAGQPYALDNKAAAAIVEAPCGGRWTQVMVTRGARLATYWTADFKEEKKQLDCDCRGRRRVGRVSGPSSELMRCLCVVESHCNPDIGCLMDVGSLSCGPYQIKLPYWIDASRFAHRKLGGDWKSCTTGRNSLSCSQEAVTYYLNGYGPWCVGKGRQPQDEDYARVHNGGPQGCRRTSTIGYWKKVQACMKGK